MPSKSVFRHGQLYVALSRVQSLKSSAVVFETNEHFNCVYNGEYYLINKMHELLSQVYSKEKEKDSNKGQIFNKVSYHLQDQN